MLYKVRKLWYYEYGKRERSSQKKILRIEVSKMEKVRMNNGIKYTIEKMSQTREFYHFNDRNSKGERIEIEFTKVENDNNRHLINLWYKKGFIKEQLENYWQVTVYAYDKEGNCYGKYNPQILPYGTRINFDWILEATKENKERILNEIIKRTYDCENK